MNGRGKVTVERLNKLGGKALKGGEPTLAKLEEYIDALVSYSKQDAISYTDLNIHITILVNSLGKQSSEAMERAILNAQSDAQKRLEDARRADDEMNSGGNRVDFNASFYEFTDKAKEAIKNRYKLIELVNKIYQLDSYSELLQIQENIQPAVLQEKFINAADALSSNSPESVILSSNRLKKDVEKVFSSPKTSLDDKRLLCDVIETASRLVQPSQPNAVTQDALKGFNKSLQKVMGIDRKWGKLIAGGMLSFLGAIIVASAVVLAIATFGVSTPLSVLAIGVGANVTVAGVTISSAVIAGVTLGAAGTVGLGLSTTAGIFANRARKGEVGMATENFADEVKAVKDLNKK